MYIIVYSICLVWNDYNGGKLRNSCIILAFFILARYANSSATNPDHGLHVAMATRNGKVVKRSVSSMLDKCRVLLHLVGFVVLVVLRLGWFVPNVTERLSKVGYTDSENVFIFKTYKQLF
ncbi:hypothetical protein PHYBLDRAFT_67365 [Phycomyces blakesleeanus NRRL 1555(-)]|uniref:Uncharacterized protein n=1 Tax=Phycomyces blakesleeanus (strain ATCC 8743b / DSM 1359 / FGSC 10004 / NBRC 33097 / NRRL 1555) TaxID=763407 RepID=A0A162THN8_PHYB8|nr:hypothetical protein PHYBLDRAFT_67365 [Phycomyces blakesleeanus NRRL 1555(-)]OAD67233.1 hypothetical protein PHYBLDRAFT_67365 [Phycomyces blakesleeanus NRRL 1555(-)]|eukprot:XP_018285273.1 hypothetical protein PHYBLDRAFT_67365 [Phycomyces blakesleeanus NRRL 1555(-)]